MPSLAALRVTIEPLEDACVIRAAGELDLDTVDRLRLPLDAARSDRLTVLVDLSGVSFIDSAGLEALLAAARAADEEEWAWFLVRPSVPVMRLLAVAGTERLLPVVGPAWGEGAVLDPALAG
jgi:anti-sigma B factor antagonist